jgi:Holliday junction resolvase RusA-like endonuclease
VTGYSIIEGMVREATNNPIVATEVRWAEKYYVATDFVYRFKLESKTWVPPRTTAQASYRILRKANGQSFIGKTSTSKASVAKKELQILLQPHIPQQPFAGAISVKIFICFPFNKTDSKHTQEKGSVYHPKKPDVDNYVKMLLDAMNKKFWVDDAQICELRVIKKRGNKPLIDIEIATIQESA